MKVSGRCLNTLAIFDRDVRTTQLLTQDMSQLKRNTSRNKLKQVGISKQN